MITLDIANPQTILPLDRRRIRRAVQLVLQGEAVPAAKLSLAVVDDATIHRLNRQFLQHDEPTDVLSFPLEQGDHWLEGEIVVSAETACRRAKEFGWSAEEELLLYVIHGLLHLAGHEDHAAEPRARMRAREQFYLKALK